jgi:transglutaminase-like putative cysteine protease
MQEYLKSSEIIDWQHPAVMALAQKLVLEQQIAKLLPQPLYNTTRITKTCFEWVRDQIYHSYDYQMNPLTCRASDVLQYKTGYCYAKSHLLAALLRSNGIPSGFCYQRLSINNNGAPYCLHGLNAVYLPEVGWYRIDARGNRAGVDAQFTPPQEKLAFTIQFPEETDCQTVFPEPLPAVIQALQSHNTWDQMLLNLPDISLESAKISG